MKITNSNFYVSLTQYDNKKYNLFLPEFAFAGKSNVGKSSLINKILNRKRLSYVSKKPGKTRTINFFDVDNKFFIVDLPGYGYSKVSSDLKLLWNKSISDYLQNSENLKVLFILIDIRREIDEKDYKLIEFCNYYNINYKFVLTKSDKLSKTKINNILKKYKSIFDFDDNPIVFSAKTGAGKNIILNFIAYVMQLKTINE